MRASMGPTVPSSPTGCGPIEARDLRKNQPFMSINPSADRASTTVSLAGEDTIKRIVTDTLFGLWATVNNLTRVRPSKRERYRVTVFGSASTEPGHWMYQEVNPIGEQAFEHQSFFTRLHQFVLMSDAYIVAPGGIGTVLESMMIWQLLQVRHLHDTPLVFAGPMWKGAGGMGIRANAAAGLRTGQSKGHADPDLRR